MELISVTHSFFLVNFLLTPPAVLSSVSWSDVQNTLFSCKAYPFVCWNVAHFSFCGVWV